MTAPGQESWPRSMEAMMLDYGIGVKTPFTTPAGRCALVWTPKALVSLDLPREWADSPPRFETREGPKDPLDDIPGFVCDAIRRIRAHLGGLVPLYDDLPVNLDAFTPFTRAVLSIVRTIPRGETRTYEEVAREAGRPHAARAVGRAVAMNPLPLIIPCHRVVAASGRLGGFSAPGGPETKRRLLALEGLARS